MSEPQRIWTEVFDGWLAVVDLMVDLACRRSSGETVPAAAIDEVIASVARQTQVGDADAQLVDAPLVAVLGRRFGLSVNEQLVIWSLVAHQISVRQAARLEALSGGPDVTLAALADLVYGGATAGALEELSARGRLFRSGLVDCDADKPTAWARRTVRVSDRLLRLAVGSDVGSRSAALTAIPRVDGVEVVERDGSCPAVGELAIDDRAVAEARQALKTGRAIVAASGMPGLGRRTLLTVVAAEAGLATLEIDARRLSKDAGVLARQLRAFARECTLLQRVPLVANLDALVDDKDSRLDVVGSELVGSVQGLVLFTTGVQRPAMRWDRPVVSIELSPPTSAQRGELWLRALGAGSESDADLLAGQYPLAPGLIHHAAIAAKARSVGRKLEPDDIYAGIRAVLDDRLGRYARRVSVTQSWDDLVLPEDQIAAILELLARIRERRRVYEQWGFAAKVGKGLGVSALFSGPPGTGKTMVAALIARDLGIELYQVDLGKVVSKWIGETEKNLGALFDAAEAGHAILLFDEADALFGKRTEVKSSNDRYANLETNYLLQRLESFTGICFLTSNHDQSIDPAFQRRMSLHLRFELPDLVERAALWQAMLPATAPVAPGLDFQALARRYAMSGGYIRNAALRAAFLAADQDGPIMPDHLERAARLEYEGMGKIVTG